MSRGAYAIIASALLAIVLAGAAWWWQTFERVEKVVDLPPRGIARYNTLFALQRSLEALGHRVQARATLDLERMRLQPDELLVLASDPRTLGEDQTAALLAWIRAGGRLLFALPASASEDPGPLLERLDLQLRDAASCLRWQDDTGAATASLCGSQRLLPGEGGESEYLQLIGDETEGYAVAEATLGEGRWTAVSTLDFLQRRRLHEPGHAALAWRLLAPLLGEGRVRLVYSVEMEPLPLLLLRHGWPILLPALLALLAWLWARSQRLGPVLPAPAGDRRALLEHLQAAAEFAFRRHRGGDLLAPLQRRFESALRRDQPAIAALSGEARLIAIAQHWRLPPQAVRNALQPEHSDRPERFVEAVRTFIQLRAKP